MVRVVFGLAVGPCPVGHEACTEVCLIPEITKRAAGNVIEEVDIQFGKARHRGRPGGLGPSAKRRKNSYHYNTG
jgi:hypothetical protein